MGQLPQPAWKYVLATEPSDEILNTALLKVVLSYKMDVRPVAIVCQFAKLLRRLDHFWSGDLAV